MTAQEVFDHVAKHMLVDQGAQCVLDFRPNCGTASCAYHAVMCINGADVLCACAVGCLILPERHTQELEGKAATADECLSEPFAKALEGVVDPRDAAVIQVLETLQVTHDRHHPSQWYECLRNVAKDLNLKLNVRRDELHPWCFS